VLSDDKIGEESTKCWLLAFWQLAWAEAQFNAACASRFDFCREFCHWRVIPALGVNGETLLPLKSAGDTFNIEGIDSDWMQSISNAICRAGFYILRPLSSSAYVCVKLVNVLELSKGQVPPSETTGLCKLLARSLNNLASLSAKDRLNLLDYLGTRHTAELSNLHDLIKQLPLVLLAHTPEADATGFTCLSSGSCVCLKEDARSKHTHVGNLINLPIPDVVHLAWPSDHSSAIYKSLGVRLLIASSFVFEGVCNALTHAAKVGEAQIDPLLTELWSWLNRDVDGKGSWAPAIADRAKAVPFIRTMSGSFLPPKQSLHPNLKIVEMFAAELMPWMPCEAFHKHANLLRLLGAARQLPPLAIAECAAALDADAEAFCESSGEHYRRVRDRSRMLLPELIKAMKGSAPLDKHLEAAAACRIALARRVRGDEDIRQHVQALLKALPLEPVTHVPDRPRLPARQHLARFDSSLALTNAQEALAWALPNFSVLARDAHDDIKEDAFLSTLMEPVNVPLLAEQLTVLVAALHATQTRHHAADNLLLGGKLLVEGKLLSVLREFSVPRELSVLGDVELLFQAMELQLAAGDKFEVGVIRELSELPCLPLPIK
jgi:hypothetical protein